jgi:hypothetical protein
MRATAFSVFRGSRNTFMGSFCKLLKRKDFMTM